MSIHILGIRHHGVGSAKNVDEALVQIRPDILLVEGPPEGEAILSWVAHREMKPPVAILAYNVAEPQQAVFYPFARFSPEWRAISYGLRAQIPVWFMDLPLEHSFALQKAEAKAAPESTSEKPADGENGPSRPNDVSPGEPEPDSLPVTHPDPMSYLARIAGYDDSEPWWEHHFEQNYFPGQATAHFEGVTLATQALRDHLTTPSSERDDLREAHMRRLIRKATGENHRTIAVVCGAWHAPALQDLESTEKSDRKLLEGLPKVDVSTTWIPWTNTRLGLFSGYGAGIVSPGWYEHCWDHPEDTGIRWLTRVAKLFRQKKMDTSTAHVIEAYRLAESLAAMRNRSRPGLAELNEATQTVICFGDAILLKLVEEELIVARNLGKVPSALPKLPLQADFAFHQHKCRLKIGEARQEYELDLRKELDLNRSKLLHRLGILGIDWGRPLVVSGKGTFKETWALRWKPEMTIELIEKGIWGNTVEDASGGFLLDQSGKSQSVAEIGRFIAQVIPAGLFSTIGKLLRRINEVATVSSDVVELMGALVPLVEVSRYGNVRKTDLSAIHTLVEGFVTRISIGLPNACYGLDEANAQRVFDHIRRVDEAVRLLENGYLTSTWQATLRVLLDKQGLQPILAGGTCRLLFDGKVLESDETGRRFGLALSAGNEPARAAGWLEGFLKGSGTILLLDQTLWNLVYQWVAELETDQFRELMPILRRTFSGFDPGERRKLGEKAKRGPLADYPSNSRTIDPVNFNHGRAQKALPVVRQLLGIP